jgi:hypothetical protein
MRRFRTHAPLLLLFGIPLITIQSDIVWDKISNGSNGDQLGPWERNFISGIFLALLGLSFVEALLNTIRLAVDRKALVITDEGVQGYHAWLRRSFRWSDVSHVHTSGNSLWIYKRAESKLLREWNRYSRPGGRYHWSQLLIVDLSCVDQPASAILAEIGRHWKPS